MAYSSSRSTCQCCTPIVAISILVVFGVALIIAGGVLIPVFDQLIHSKVKEQTPIKNNSEAYNNWHHPTSPVVMNYYLFDIMNPDDIMKGKTPEVKQRGPYAYREVRYNNPKEWSSDGKALTYTQNIAYHFDAGLSCANCTPDDVITTPNIALMTIADMVKDLSGAERFLVSSLIIDLSHAKLFHPLAVHKILWGFNDPTLLLIKKDKKMLPFLPIPNVDPWVALQRNASIGEAATGNLTMLTGKGNVNNVQQIVQWRGQKSLPYWKTKYGNMINGSDGTHFKPFSQKTDIIYLFVTDVCRSLYLVYDSEVKSNGIKLYRFTTDDMLYANYTVNPDNIAFCVPECYAAGLLPVGQCIPMNPPIMISAPHFYQGAPHLWQSFKGLKPEKSKHATFLDLEPYTGLTMVAYKRLQINLQIKSIKYIRILDGIKTMVFPIFYVEEHAQIGPADADKFKSMVYTPILITQVVQYLAIALGALLFVVAVLVGICKKPKTSTSLVINKNESERQTLIPNGHDHVQPTNNYQTIS